MSARKYLLNGFTAIAAITLNLVSFNASAGERSDVLPGSFGVSTDFPSVVTQISDTDGELWACRVDNRVVAMYMFLPAGAIPGLNPEHQLGMEIDPSLPGMAHQKRYLWSMADAATLIMDMPDRGEKLIWNDIEFTHADRLTASSRERGELTCIRGTGSKGVK